MRHTMPVTVVFQPKKQNLENRIAENEPLQEFLYQFTEVLISIKII